MNTHRELHTAMSTADAICIRDGSDVVLMMEETLTPSTMAAVRLLLLPAVDTAAPAAAVTLARGGHKHLL